MADGSPWEMVVCEYCNERMHYSRIDEHKRMVHARVMEAEDTLRKMTKRETRLFFGLVGWFFIIAILVLVGWAVGIYDSSYYIGLILSSFAIFPIIAVLQLFEPNEDKERRKAAKEIVLSNKVKCDICEQMIAVKEYVGHIKSVHPEQVPYEWFRIATAALFMTIFVGGFLGLGLLLETHWLPIEETALYAVGWIALTCIYMIWIFYMSQVGELKHIKRMQERWQAGRFAPRDIDSTRK